MKKKVLVVDLDGTLYTINTFHYFIKFLIIDCFSNLKIGLLFKLCIALASRIFTSHSKMKHNVLKLLNNRSDINYECFVKSISSKKRHISHLEENKFHTKVLATAAPSCYAKVIAQNEGFDVCIGTSFPSIKFNSSFENKSEVKKSNVLNYLKKQKTDQIDLFITDHIDDLPLMKLAKKNIIVQPNNGFLLALKQNSISFEVIK
ncbi:haloacid dehalogenase-like hydrolase [Flaviramulus sp. BrNp1-15]|uniref:HAD family hydrolase n=1 Tax=Flaviramulus sp. BrNp1-15 TaxID=2916754 RepID=UPI001EE8943C|nr:HAD family hydrolase [Flaviramulus sp. BrNp1-15]ULC60524.1 haloacid dehalogenase-like hydrolase [Flaviramulus sp. BrNp1-15]